MTFTPSEHRPLRDSEWQTPESCSCGTWDVQNEFRTWEQHVDELARVDRELAWNTGRSDGASYQRAHHRFMDSGMTLPRPEAPKNPYEKEA